MRADAFLQLRMREVGREKGGEKCGIRIYMVTGKLWYSASGEICFDRDEERDTGDSENTHGADGQEGLRTGPAGESEDNKREADERHYGNGGVAQEDTKEAELKRDRAAEA